MTASCYPVLKLEINLGIQEFQAENLGQKERHKQTIDTEPNTSNPTLNKSNLICCALYKYSNLFSEWFDYKTQQAKLL